MKQYRVVIEVEGSEYLVAGTSRFNTAEQAGETVEALLKMMDPWIPGLCRIQILPVESGAP